MRCRICLTGEVGFPASVYAFYLPQFHRIPENDNWWGAGFTEWTNVARAKPLFSNHEQPKIPGELGFYDLTNQGVLSQQGQLAQQYGIDAFCVYFYWFGSKRLLHKPLELMSSVEGAHPFFICWANENWSRTWDGNPLVCLERQTYGLDFEKSIFQEWLPLLLSENYYSMAGSQPILIYKPEEVPRLAESISYWKSEARKRGVKLSFLGVFRGQETTGWVDSVDSIVQFPPSASRDGAGTKSPENLQDHFSGQFYDYRIAAKNALSQVLSPTDKPLIPGVMPGWDNSPRKALSAQIFLHASPELFRDWALSAIASQRLLGEEAPTVMVNAWNEWAEGATLEPEFGKPPLYLEAIRDAKESCEQCRERTLHRMISTSPQNATGKAPNKTLKALAGKILGTRIVFLLASIRSILKK